MHGESIYRQASFLAGKLGQKVAADTLTVIDDGTLPGLFGTSPFDDEGLPGFAMPIIEEGVLYRSSRSVPLSDVLGVNVQAGPWQGFVELATSRGNRDPRRALLGPLRSPEARELGRTIRQASVR